MSRNGPLTNGGRPPVRRHPDDQFTSPPTGQPAPHWPPAGAQFQDAHGHQQQQGYYFPQATEPEPNYGYGQQHGQQAAAQQSPPPFSAFPPSFQPQHQQPLPQSAAWNPPQGDPRGFDLGNYMPPGAHGYQQPAPAAFAPDHHQGDGYQSDGQHGYAEQDAEYDGEFAEEEEPRFRRRGLMIAAALVGAIGLGGAMAYTYKSFFSSSGQRAPLITAANSGPSKVRPETPGGKEFAHTDKKLLNRLPDERVAAATPAAGNDAEERASDDPNAPRRVKIIPITPGSGPPGVVTSSVPPPRASGPPMVAVPGVTLESGPMAPRPQPPAAAAPPPPPPPPMAQPAAPMRAATPAPQAPVRVASAAPTEVPSAVEAPPAKRIAPPPKAPVPKVKEAAVAPAAAPASVTTSTSGTSGYVAVLSSKKSRMDALKAFADLQQKYGDVLATRTPDVQEANLGGEKGVWYRAVVGPPGSREAAAGVCTQLKAAGHAGCWVTAY